jgi:hypothetical protein
VREPKHPNYDPDIGTIEENGTIRWYIYKPAFMSHQTQQNAPGKTRALQDLVRDPSIIKAAAEASNQLQRDTVKLSQTQNLPRREEKKSQPAQNYQAPPKTIRWQDSPEYKRPIHKCCPIAIACYEKRLPVTHSQGCVEKQAAIK